MPYRDDEQKRAYNREWMRMRRTAESGTPGGTPLPSEFRLRTAQDVIDLLSDQIEAVRDEKTVGTLERARTIGFLAGIALKAIEAGNMAARLEALEAVLKARNAA
jgi:hypothetical protein